MRSVQKMNEKIARRMRLLKPFRRIRAFFGYFWLPCPICGENFGGFEWGETLYDSWSSGTGVCPACGEEALRRNKLYFENNSAPPVYVYENAVEVRKGR